MCNPTPSRMAELRDVLRDLLEEKGISDPEVVEELVMGIIATCKIAFTTTEKNPRRRGVEAAMMAGLNRVEGIKSRCYERFRVNYPWHTKQGQDVLEFLTTRPENETIDKWADWWWSDPWRKQKKGSPSLTDIYSFWPTAFEKPEYNSEKSSIKIFRAGEDE